MAQALKRKIKQVFTQAQSSVTAHERLLKQLKALYDEMPEDAFLSEFSRCLQVPLVYGDKHKVVENTLNFASKFVSSLLKAKPVDAEGEEDEEEISPFVLNILKFLFDNHNSENQAIRFRVCQFINKILNSLGSEACLDDNLCDQILECMMESLQDRAPAVRMQAVLALHRLQDPADASCRVMKAFIFHMKADPNPDVRRAVLTNIAITSQSLKAVMERTYDSKDVVRKSAYVCLSKLGVQRFSIGQRVRLLTNGLKDQSAIVHESVAKIMLPTWLQFYKGSFCALLHALDCENATEISSMALQALFKSEPIKKVLEELTNLLNDDKVIPIEDQLTPEKVLYWKVLVEYLEEHPEVADDRPIDEPLPELLPELSTFCNYIQQFYEAKAEEQVEDWVKQQNQYVLIKLLELCKCFDLADEMGRANLQKLCLYFLTNNAVSEDVVPILVELMVNVVPNVEDRLQILAEAISELREPMIEQEPEPTATAAAISSMTPDELRERELKQSSIRVELNVLEEEQYQAVQTKNFDEAKKLEEKCEKLRSELKNLNEVCSVPVPAPSENPTRTESRDVIKDEAALRKCLRIVREMVQSETVKGVSATLRSLMQNFVLACLQEDNSTVIRNKGLEVLGLFCILDKPLAQENFFMFIFQIASDEVCEVALKVTFDLLLLYGLDTFQIQDNSGETSEKKKSKKKKNLFATDMFEDDFDTEEEETQETHPSISSGSSGNTSNLIAMLTSLLDSASTSMRNIAMEGLYKLLMACRIKSSALLSRLILMWYSPVTDGDEHLRQPLAAFLQCYASHCPRSQETLEQAFLPTLHTLMQAPVTSPLTAIDQDSVVRLFLSLTRPGINKYHSKMSHIHNNLAISICNAIIDFDDNTNVGVLLKALSSLELSLDDTVYREELKTLLKNVKEIFSQTKEKQYYKNTLKLIQVVENAENSSMRTTEVDNTAVSSQLNGTNVHLSTDNTVESEAEPAPRRNKNAKLMRPDMQSLNENEEEEEEEEEDENSQITPPANCSVVIPASPPRSQSSEEEEEEDHSTMQKGNQSRLLKSKDAPVDEGLFKKPAAKAQQMNKKGADKRGKESSSSSDLSPVVKRRRKGQSDNVENVTAPSKAMKATNRKNQSVSPENKSNKVDKEEQQSGPVRVSGSKRIIHPTEKGATLKTFQNTSVVQSLGSSVSTSPPSASSSRNNTLVSTSSADQSPRKQAVKAKKANSKNLASSASSSGQEVDSDSSPQPRRRRLSGRESKTSPPLRQMGSSPSRSRGSKMDPDDSPSRKTRSGKNRDDVLPPTMPPRRKSVLPSDSSVTDSDSPSRTTRSSGQKSGREVSPPKRSSGKKSILTVDSSATDSDSPSRATRSAISKLGDKVLRRRRSSREKSVLPSFGSSTTDSDSSPVLQNRRSLKKIDPSVKLPTQSQKTVSSSTSISESESDNSPAARRRKQDKKASDSQQPQNLIEKLKPKEAASVRTTRSSLSQTDSEAMSVSPPVKIVGPRRTRPNTDEIPKSGKQKVSGNKAIKSSSEEDSLASPTASNFSNAKKRTADILTNESTDSESPQYFAKGRKQAKAEEAQKKSVPPQLQKKTNTQTPSKDSPVTLPSRRSLRSQTETPSPRTRSGRV